MEYIGVPLVSLIRDLGPPLVVVVLGLALAARWRPRRPRLVVAALLVHLFAAALPYLWISAQVFLGLATQSAAGLVMILVQPAVQFAAWVLLLVGAIVPPRGAPPGSPSPARSSAVTEEPALGSSR
ncbi:hypothetical protein ACQEU5_17280 [Marinactinospora thermotolerans]|uniref:hypothetical protein n=1 Tax=Marinactinospora thermotolerans TaxID=531310 RepID=UPI003D8F71BE